jgi:hypothetical protein
MGLRWGARTVLHGGPKCLCTHAHTHLHIWFVVCTNGGETNT